MEHSQHLLNLSESMWLEAHTLPYKEAVLLFDLSASVTELAFQFMRLERGI